MAELIDLEGARGYVQTFFADPILKMAANAVLNNAPGFDLVRCKNCKHSKWYPDDNIRLCNNSNGLFGNVCDGDYCSKGERKDNERNY